MADPAEGAASRGLLDAWEERAAIREYEGGQSRDEAEREAALELGIAIKDGQDPAVGPGAMNAGIFRGGRGSKSLCFPKELGALERHAIQRMEKPQQS